MDQWVLLSCCFLQGTFCNNQHCQMTCGQVKPSILFADHISILSTECPGHLQRCTRSQIRAEHLVYQLYMFKPIVKTCGVRVQPLKEMWQL